MTVAAIGRGALWVLDRAISGLIGYAVGKGADIFLEDKTPQKPTEQQPSSDVSSEQKINQFKDNLQQNGFRLLERDPEVNKLAREIGSLERRGEFNNPFNKRARTLEKRLEVLLQTKIEPMAQKEAYNLGLNYHTPLNNLFIR